MTRKHQFQAKLDEWGQTVFGGCQQTRGHTGYRSQSMEIKLQFITLRYHQKRSVSSKTDRKGGKVFSASEQTGPANIGNRDIKLQYFDQYAQIWLENISFKQNWKNGGQNCFFFRIWIDAGCKSQPILVREIKLQYVVHYAQIWLENIGFKQNWTNEGKLFWGSQHTRGHTGYRSQPIEIKLQFITLRYD